MSRLAFLADKPLVLGKQWAVVRREDTRGSLFVYRLTHHQMHQTFYGQRGQSDVFSVRAKNIVGWFETEALAEGAIAAAAIAWAKHAEAVAKARLALREVETAREDSLWNAVREFNTERRQSK